jgi:hypothetical protein
MKKIKFLFITLSIALVFVSCKKDDEPDTTSSSSSTNTTTTTDTTTTTTTKIVINEVVSNPKSGTGEDWIELYNAGTTTVDLSGYKLTDSKGLSSSETYTIPSGTTIAAGKFLVFEKGTSFTFGLSSTGDGAILANASGTIIDQLTFGAMATANESYGRKPDGSSNLYYFTVGTQGTTNDASTVEN